MYALVVLTLGVYNLHCLVLAHQYTAVAYLSAHLSIEGGVVEHQLVVGVLLLCHLAVAQYVAVVFGEVVAHELLFSLSQFHPVAVLHLCSVACSFLLLLHLHVKLLFVHSNAVLAAYQFCKVQGEAVGVEQAESLGAVQLGLALFLQSLHSTVEHVDALVECAQERVFLFLHYMGDKLALCHQFGIGTAHLLNKYGEQTEDKCLFLVEEGVGVAHGTAQDAAYHIAGLGVAGQLSVGNREGNGTQMVSDNTHSHIHLFAFAIFQRGESLYLLDYRLEHVGVVVGVLALQGAHKAFKAHTSVDNVHGEFLQTAVSLAVELHEHQVPYLDDLWVVFVHQLSSCHFGLLFGCTRVEVNLRAGTARTRIAHFPEVVVLVAIDDVIGRHVLQPVAFSLVVTLQLLLFRTLEHGDIKVGGVELEHIYKVFPCHVDGALFEVVAKTPVAQHFKHGVVVGVVPHLFQVVVLATYTKAFL